MQLKGRLSGGVLQHEPVQSDLLPVGKCLRLARRQVCPHGKFCCGQVQGVGKIGSHRISGTPLSFENCYGNLWKLLVRKGKAVLSGEFFRDEPDASPAVLPAEAQHAELAVPTHRKNGRRLHSPVAVPDALILQLTQSLADGACARSRGKPHRAATTQSSRPEATVSCTGTVARGGTRIPSGASICRRTVSEPTLLIFAHRNSATRRSQNRSALCPSR